MSQQNKGSRLLDFKWRCLGLQLWLRRLYDHTGLGRGLGAFLLTAGALTCVLIVSVFTDASLARGLAMAAGAAIAAGAGQLLILLPADDAVLAQRRQQLLEELSAQQREAEWAAQDALNGAGRFTPHARPRASSRATPSADWISFNCRAYGCDGILYVDPGEIGSPVNCPLCGKSQVYVGDRREDDTHCVQCGRRVGQAVVCPVCGCDQRTGISRADSASAQAAVILQQYQQETADGMLSDLKLHIEEALAALLALGMACAAAAVLAWELREHMPAAWQTYPGFLVPGTWAVLLAVVVWYVFLLVMVLPTLVSLLVVVSLAATAGVLMGTLGSGSLSPAAGALLTATTMLGFTEYVIFRRRGEIHPFDSWNFVGTVMAWVQQGDWTRPVEVNCYQRSYYDLSPDWWWFHAVLVAVCWLCCLFSAIVASALSSTGG